jgi:Na+/H+ antiporter
VVLLLLAVVAVFAVVAERLKVPYPIMLVLAGLGLSLIPHVPRVPLNPQLVFLVFLPPLLFRAAWMTSWREFKDNLIATSMLAVGLVAFTVWGVAEFSDRFIAALDWRSGLLLGAVVATTDALAASAVAKQVGLPRRILNVLEGESLLNDSTGLLALQLGVVLLMENHTPTPLEALGTLAWLVAGGVSMGLLVGVIMIWCERRINNGSIEMVLNVIAAYASYLLAERIGASGVLSTVVCGLLLGRKSAEFFSPQVRLRVTSVWEALDFALNGIVFCIIGLQLPYVLEGIREYSWKSLALDGLLFSAVLILLRLVWVYPGAWVGWSIRNRLMKKQERRPSAKGIFVVGWTGMRGVMTLAAALSLPETLSNGQPFHQRDLILFLAFCVILVTLVAQGLTLPPLIRALGLAGGDRAGEAEERCARRSAVDAGIAWLQERRDAASPEHVEIVDGLLRQYQRRSEAAGIEGSAREDARVGAYLAIAQGAAQAERRALLKLRAEGEIGDEAMRAVELELDLTETRIEAVR